ncbi:Glycosyltransferase involved in cell wall bisynthesis [Lentibacillus persicus]|uniref:Glycosyltransferase involved in cell wall bisynthesis n=1 Tax=Lentibacillus persicus TaxID=640948 RepID=A0A1I1U7U8_9BACI|nr:glycosyltransferase [Lentibacillus persicus]SFD66849.1 Glycosyltransferase involved in cell wall bisynthesis [Lentibacillus persicus]
MAEISIIVPVYNLERLLPRCVDSILAQTFTDFELILVNDGSSDGTGKLCNAYARADNRVKVVHKENGGVASARNAGLNIAKGRYIGFADNDDLLNQYMFEVLYDIAVAHSSDIVICNYVEVDEDASCDTKTYEDNYQVRHFDHIEALHQLYTANYITFVVPWNKLYKRYLFDNIRFEEGNINDDETVAHKLFYQSGKTTFVQTGLYYYIQRKGSLMHSPFKVNQLDAVYALKQREVFFRKKKERTLHQKALKHYMEKFFWYYFLAKSSSQETETALKKLKRTFNRSLIHLLKSTEISGKQKIMCVVFSISPVLFVSIRNISAKQQANGQTKI